MICCFKKEINLFRNCKCIDGDIKCVVVLHLSPGTTLTFATHFDINIKQCAPFDCYSSLWLKAIVFKEYQTVKTQHMDVQHQSGNCKIVLMNAKDRKKLISIRCKCLRYNYFSKNYEKLPAHRYDLIAHLLANRGRPVRTYLTMCIS